MNCESHLAEMQVSSCEQPGTRQGKAMPSGDIWCVAQRFTPPLIIIATCMTGNYKTITYFAYNLVNPNLVASRYMMEINICGRW